MAFSFVFLVWCIQLLFHSVVCSDTGVCSVERNTRLVIDISSTQDLHNIASSPDELISLFGVDSVGSVPDYEVRRIHVDRTRRDITDTKHYKLSAFDKDFNLELTPTNDVVSPTLVVTRKVSDNHWEKDLYTPEGQFYQGHVTSDPNSHVAVREMRDDGKLSGSIFMDNHFYKVHPIPDHMTSRMSIKEPGYHVISRRSLDHINKDFFPEPLKVLLDKNDESLVRNKHRVRRELTPKYIEAMITMDKLSCDYYGNISMDFVLEVANMVNRLYNDKSLELDVRWTLTKVFLIQAYEEGLDVNKHNLDSAVRYLVRFSQWAKDKNTPAGEVEHWDNGVLLSRKICGIKSCTLGGVAYSGVPCSSTQGYTINHANGLDAAFYVAHEMGHNFGLTHDSGKCKDGYMMNSGQASGPKAFQWSTCSSDQLKTIFNRVKCYDNKPPSNITLPVVPPGHKYNADKQCKFLYGDDYRLCPVTTGNCALLFCYKHSGCASAGTPPVDGTPCAHRKWCIGGHCVDIGNSVPPAIDGGWGAWGQYMPCSRTCGGGIQYRMRECNNPSPQNHGKSCQGLSIGEWRICNERVECPPGTPHYRKIQCLAKNNEYSDFYGSKTCRLWCRQGNKVMSEGSVADGTKFSDEPNHLDICITGKQEDVGCDGVLHSKTIADRCLKCLGNGSTCVRVTGSYTKNHRNWGAASADSVIVLPAGTTHFYMEENSKTMNLLNMKLFPAKSNSLIFPERPYASTRNAAGTVIKYNISNSELKYAESMEFEGPTTQALVVMFVFVGFETNVGYKYRFIKPGKAPDTNFTWKTVLLDSCSATCAGGLRPQKVTCHRQDDQSEISNTHCNNKTTPKDVVGCNTQPCPGRWESELWGPCSNKCGGGTRARVVPCIQQITAQKYRVVKNSNCNNSSRPHQEEGCNFVDCAPVWVVGEWSACAQFDSTFLTRRRVGCQAKLSNGTTMALNITMCSELTTTVPESERECTIPTASTLPLPTDHTDHTSTTKIITIIAERDKAGVRAAQPKPSTGSRSRLIDKPWVYAVIVVLAVAVALSITLLVLYRLGKLPCKNQSQAQPKISTSEMQPLQTEG